MDDFAFGQQRGELVPQRVDDRRWQSRHEHLGEVGGVRYPFVYRGSCLSFVTDTRLPATYPRDLLASFFPLSVAEFGA